MMSDRKIRMVDAQTPPFSAVVIVKSNGIDAIWAQARAEALLMEQIQAQIGPCSIGMAYLRKLGVYTVDYNPKTLHYIHQIDAPDGIVFTAVEEVPRWWEAVDDLPIHRVPNGHALTISLLPTITMDAWRKSGWPDRPHP